MAVSLPRALLISMGIVEQEGMVKHFFVRLNIFLDHGKTILRFFRYFVLGLRG